MNNAPHVSVQAIVLAAGKSTRFKGKVTKLLTPLCGLPIIGYVAEKLKRLQLHSTFIVGHEAQAIKKTVLQHAPDAQFVDQLEQRGTGHALMQTENVWHAHHVLVVNGDCPLVHPYTIERLIKLHTEKQAAITFVVAQHPDPNNSYGRVVVQKNKIEIIEAKDLKDKNGSQNLPINAGIYIMRTDFLRKFLQMLTTDNAAGEYYITDLIGIAQKNGLLVHTVSSSLEEVQGINTMPELIFAEQIQRSWLVRAWIQNGVTFTAPGWVTIDTQAHIGAGTLIGAGVHILGSTQIGQNCVIQPFTLIENSVISDEATVLSHSIIQNSLINKHATIGPFVYVRLNSIIKHGVDDAPISHVAKNNISQSEV